ncbi:MAG TPA: hypothetical protein VF666_10295 [Pyrinomonadaceae bacterium]|jgi:hypothetical protein
MPHHNQLESTNPASSSIARRDLFTSLGVLAFIVVFALSGLAADANYRKFSRVLIAFLTYNTMLLTLYALLKTRTRSASASTKGHLPFWAFAAAACAAELASGWWRTNASASVVFTVAPVAALLVGGVHWFALRSWRQLRARIVSTNSATNTATPRRASS